jgi:hypothetical protein
MPNIDEIAAQITAADVPVLFLDTCVLLDIIRSTDRCDPNDARHASELLKLISKPIPQCLLVISSHVCDEWDANAPRVTEEVISHLAKMEKQSSHFHDACEALDVRVGFGRASYTRLGLAEKLRDLSHMLLSEAIYIHDDDDITSRVFARLKSGIPPSKKNGQWMDCFIIEGCLAVCRRLHASGFARKCVFCTSNTNDYCDSGKQLHSKLADEFSSCTLLFTRTLPWALNKITS